MPAAVRYIGMFRAAAVVYLLFGGSFLWTFGLTDRYAAYRLYGLGGGLLLIAIGVFLFRRARLAIGLSVLGTAAVCLLALLALPSVHGPAILFFALLGLLSGLYSALALRVLVGRPAAEATRRTPGA